MVSLFPMIVNTSESVMARFSPEERECFTDEEFDFKYLKREDGFRYSLQNCFYSSLIEKVFLNCSCSPDFFTYVVDEAPEFPPCRYNK